MQSRYWCITDNKNVTEAYWLAIWATNALCYLCAQPEQVARLHVQAFACYPRKKRFGAVSAMFPGAHIEPMRGSVDQAAAYCRKPESWTEEWRLEKGIMPAQEQGKRSDLEAIRDMCKEEKSIVEIIDQIPGALRYMREIKSYSQLLEAAKPSPPEQLILRPWQQDFFQMLSEPPISRRIWWIWSGLSGVGKTTTMRMFMDSFPGTVLIGSRKLCDFLYPFDARTHRVIWFDMARSDPLDAEMTTVLEQVSNATQLMSTKYESCMKRVRVHVVVTSNRPPPEERLPQRCVEMRLLQDGTVWNAEPAPAILQDVQFVDDGFLPWYPNYDDAFINMQ